MGNSHVDVRMCLKGTEYNNGFVWSQAFNKDNSLLFVATTHQKIHVIDWMSKQPRGEISC